MWANCLKEKKKISSNWVKSVLFFTVGGCVGGKYVLGIVGLGVVVVGGGKYVLGNSKRTFGTGYEYPSRSGGMYFGCKMYQNFFRFLSIFDSWFSMHGLI